MKKSANSSEKITLKVEPRQVFGKKLIFTCITSKPSSPSSPDSPPSPSSSEDLAQAAEEILGV